MTQGAGTRLRKTAGAAAAVTGLMLSAGTLAASPAWAVPTLTPLIFLTEKPAVQQLGDVVGIEYTIENPNASGTGNALSGVRFTDTLPAGLQFQPGTLATACGAGVAAHLGRLSASGITLAADTSCAIEIDAVTTAGGAQANSVTVTSDQGPGNTATATVDVIAPLSFAQNISPTWIPPGISARLSFAIGNSDDTARKAVGFADPLPSGLRVASPNHLTGSCGDGTISAAAGGSTISLTGATLGSARNCSFSVTVTGTSIGARQNTAGPISSKEGGQRSNPSWFVRGGAGIDPANGRVYRANSGSGTIACASLDAAGTGVTSTCRRSPSISRKASPSTSPAGGGHGADPGVPRAAQVAVRHEAPAVSGGPTTGSVLRCGTGSWAADQLGAFLYQSPQSFSYGWSRNGTVIAGAAKSSLTARLAGCYRCTVTASNGAGSASQQSSARPAEAAPASAGDRGRGGARGRRGRRRAGRRESPQGRPDPAGQAARTVQVGHRGRPASSRQPQGRGVLREQGPAKNVQAAVYGSTNGRGIAVGGGGICGTCEAKSPAAVRANLAKFGYAKVASYPGGPKGGTVACGTEAGLIRCTWVDSGTAGDIVFAGGFASGVADAAAKTNQIRAVIEH